MKSYFFFLWMRDSYFVYSWVHKRISIIAWGVNKRATRFWGIFSFSDNVFPQLQQERLQSKRIV